MHVPLTQPFCSDPGMSWQIRPWLAMTAYVIPVPAGMVIHPLCMQERRVTCMQGGVPVSASAANYSTVCPASSMPAASRACSAAGCRPVVWLVGAWSPCSAGVMNRTLECTVLNGGQVSLSVRICRPEPFRFASGTSSSCVQSRPCQSSQSDFWTAANNVEEIEPETEQAGAGLHAPAGMDAAREPGVRLLRVRERRGLRRPRQLRGGKRPVLLRRRLGGAGLRCGDAELHGGAARMLRGRRH